MSDRDPDVPAPPPRPPGTVRVGRIAGADLLISPSVLLLIGMVALVMQPLVRQTVPEVGAWAWLVGVVYAVVLYLAVLLHEISHAVVARHYGFGVDSITLRFLGGATAVDGESRTPAQEFWIAVVGPITSLAIGVLAHLASGFLEPGVVRLVVNGMAWANIVIGVLNLVPGLPLDGGRVLRAIVWRLSGNMHRGTIVAGWGGRATAVLVLLWPPLESSLTGRPASTTTWIIAAVLAVFLWSGATAAMTSARLRRRLPALVARRLARRTLAVPEDLPLAEAVRRAQEEQAGSLLTVTSSGDPVGLVSEAAVAAVPEQRRPWVPVSSVAQPLTDDLRLAADVAGEDLVLAISRRPAEAYLLVEPDGGVLGVLATSDVDRAFREGD